MDISELLERIEQVDNLPNYIQAVSLAILGLLIPFAIAILTEFYQKTRSPDEKFSRLDVLVILDKVFKIKNIIFYILLIFTPLTLWEFSNGLYRLVIVIISAIGIALMIKTIVDLYRWTKGDAFTYRYSFLKDLKNNTDLETAWDSVWKTSNINSYHELNLFEIFSSTVEKKFEKESTDILLRLLYSFGKYLDKRSIYLLINKNLLEKLMRWHFIAWKKIHGKIKETSNITHWFMIKDILEQILREVRWRILKQETSMFYMFIEHFKNNINEFFKLLSPPDNEKYVRHMLRDIYRMFFDGAGVPEHIDIWNFFPDEWKITKRNIQDKSNVAAKITLKYFYKWSTNRLLSPERDYDELLDRALCNVFPEVDPILWAQILMIALLSPVSDDEVKSAIERKWTFGFLPRFYGFYAYQSEAELAAPREREITNTHELAILLFPNLFTREKLTELIEKAKALRYPGDSLEEKRRQLLIETFQGMLNFLEQGSLKS